ncbi:MULTISPECIES: TetR/AcrR family transcriptional regulator [unclassified Arthrobacter]|uniref:TetR/AcrR family transcriptional regulator n=1 Tax=unclassified Arthrobacter TaxID=235627 RepID=UPI001D14F0C1|nr:MULTISPECIES: TetR family transcriptional regulator C-terminal domain-containing protein [unclassified Arthrobacter]MCC3289356.1 TetR family transcriptional regulator C-terminal domain-containing protein [Arthrobacter sp. zg-Y1110]MCC3301127.1 TetR family transcriptional regulator C-terminal domain-containing protein [Arthrobacter sp. zg-Y895]UWX85194.1 TetR family transcriptional regulator C-terminal domain-containing protein [Arthrobacter sp. zg-Y1110]
MESPRNRALDAAIDLVGTQGLRALTHGRVDAAAELPRGSTSNYFRTRAQLLAGVLGRIAEREMGGISGAFAAGTPAELIDSLGTLIETTTGPLRVLTTARLAVFLEASRDPQLQEVASGGRQAMRAVIADAFERLGAAEPGRLSDAVVACCEGLILHRITRGDTTDPRAVFAAILAGKFPGSDS